MQKTKIEYLDFSWNPIAMRCTPVSEGCANCWHQVMANRLRANTSFHFNVRRAYAGEGPPVLIEKRLEEPLRRKKPTRFSVQFMGDLFHEDVPFSFIGKVFATMIAADWHTFQVLTKRPKTMRTFLSWFQAKTTLSLFMRSFRHIWLGVSVENQAAADERIPLLLQTPAAVRFVSLEPLLAPVDLTHYLRYHKPRNEFDPCSYTRMNKLSWVICGGESGSGARPMNPQWARDIRDQCRMADVPFFFKQHGAWLGIDQMDHLLVPGQTWADIDMKTPQEFVFGDGTVCVRVGKKAASRLLDGQLWEQMPALTKPSSYAKME